MQMTVCHQTLKRVNTIDFVSGKWLRIIYLQSNINALIIIKKKKDNKTKHDERNSENHKIIGCDKKIKLGLLFSRIIYI